MGKETNEDYLTIDLLGQAAIDRAFDDIYKEFPSTLTEHPLLPRSEDFSPDFFIATYLVKLKDRESIGFIVLKRKEKPDFGVGVCSVNEEFQDTLDQQKEFDDSLRRIGNLLLSRAADGADGVMAYSSNDYLQVASFLKERGISLEEIANMLKDEARSELVSRSAINTSQHLR